MTLENGPLGWAEGKAAIQLDPDAYQIVAFILAPDGVTKLYRVDHSITVPEAT